LNETPSKEQKKICQTKGLNFIKKIGSAARQGRKLHRSFSSEIGGHEESVMETKICTKCGAEYPATIEFFEKFKKGKYGLLPTCRHCRKEYEKPP
jgi:hypothetical protein